MKYREAYKSLIKEFLNKGGNPLFTERLSPFYSLENEAKLRFELRKLTNNKKQLTKSKQQNNQQPLAISQKLTADNLNNVGLISEYPIELHNTYLERKQQFITACSLKMQLNNVLETDTKKAYALQLKIMKCFDFVDDANNKLNYYRKFKKILNTKTAEDFSKLSVYEKVKKRNTVRSNISKRSKTLLKLEQEVATASDKNKLRLQSKLAKKTEELETLKQQVNELDLMIK